MQFNIDFAISILAGFAIVSVSFPINRYCVDDPLKGYITN